MRKKKASVKLKQTLLVLACVGAAASANAVVLNPRGTGQVLLYPYYTVNGGNQTLLTVGNSTEHGKAVRVRILEGRNGVEVLQFNVYLSPFDVWTAAIFTQSPNGSANLVTDDNSCTYPAIKTSMDLPTLADGRRYVAFRNSAYSGHFADEGPDNLERTREGYLEVIEMGTVIDASPTYTAMAHQLVGSEFIPADCSYLHKGWGYGVGEGYWFHNPTTDLHNPTGGLFGNSAIVNTAAGTMITYSADALEEFRQDPADVPRGSTNTVVMNAFPGSVRPTLADALTDPAHNLASASVLIDGSLVRADYPADTRGIDAVTAVLMSNTLSNDYIVDPVAGAQSEWVLSFPTRRHYHHYNDNYTIIEPFIPIPVDRVPAPAGDQCVRIKYMIANREDKIVSGDPICFSGSPYWCGDFQMDFCYDTQTISLNHPHHYYGSPSETGSFLGSALNAAYDRAPADIGFLHGWMQLDLLTARGDPHRMRPALDGTIFEGLPAIGFLATNFVNNNVQAGVLANYSGAFPYRSTARCTRGSGSCP